MSFNADNHGKLFVMRVYQTNSCRYFGNYHCSPDYQYELFRYVLGCQ